MTATLALLGRTMRVAVATGTVTVREAGGSDEELVPAVAS